MTASTPLFELVSGHWRVLEGPVFGLSQPAMIGQARARLPAGLDLTALDDMMSAFTTEPLPPAAPGQSAESMLIIRALHWLGAVQRAYKVPVSTILHARARPPDAHGIVCVDLALPCVAPAATQAVVRWLEGCLRQLVVEGCAPVWDPSALQQHQRWLAECLDPHAAHGLNMERFLRAADDMGVPVSPVAAGIYRFGTGASARWLYSSYIDTTSTLGARVAKDKLATARVLRGAGLPGAEHQAVADDDAAVRVAQSYGYPVVVKPADRQQGMGVEAGLLDAASVRRAFARARALSERILVERHMDGDDFRLTVFRGRVIQVVGRRPGGVTGDGMQTLAELVDREGRRPESLRRARDHGKPALSLDDEARELASQQGLQPGSVVAREQFVRLRRKANVSAGGVPYRVPETQVHADNLALAVHAAQAMRLELAGVDLIVPDIGRSWREVGGGICEVNGQPQISQTGSPEIYAQILRELLGERHSVPLWVYLSRKPPTALAELSARRPRLGVASREGVWVGGDRCGSALPHTVAAAQALLANPGVDHALLHLCPRDVTRRGLPTRWIDRLLVAPDALADREVLGWLAPHVRDLVVLPLQAPAEGIPELAGLRQERQADAWSVACEAFDTAP